MKWIVSVYLFLFIYRPFEYWPILGEYHIERIYAIFMIGAILVTGKTTVKFHSIFTSFLLFFFVVICSAFWALDPAASYRVAEDYAKLLVLFFAIVSTANTREDLEFYVKSFVYIFMIYATKSLWEFFINDRHVYRMGIRRLIGIDQTYSDPNSFAASVNYTLPFLNALIRNSATARSRKVLWGFFVILVVCVLFTGSRSGYLCLMLGGLMFAISNTRKRARAIVLCILCAGLIYLLLPASYITRFETIYNPSINASANESAEGRIVGFRQGMELFFMRPATGFGAGNYVVAKRILGDYSEMKSHNMFADLFSELGLLGFISLLFIIYSFTRSWMQTRENIENMNTENDGRMLGFVAMASIQVLILLLFSGIFGHNLYRYNWLIIGGFLMLSERFSYCREAINGKAGNVSMMAAEHS